MLEHLYEISYIHHLEIGRVTQLQSHQPKPTGQGFESISQIFIQEAHDNSGK